MWILRRGRLRSVSTLSSRPCRSSPLDNSKFHQDEQDLFVRKTQQKKRSQGATEWSILPRSEESPASRFTPWSIKVGGEGRSLIESAITVCAFLLQFFRTVALSKSPDLFHVIEPPNWLGKFPSACNLAGVHAERGSQVERVPR